MTREKSKICLIAGSSGLLEKLLILKTEANVKAGEVQVTKYLVSKMKNTIPRSSLNGFS